MFSPLKYVSYRGGKRSKGNFMAFYKVQNGIKIQSLHFDLHLRKHGHYIGPFQIHKCCGSQVKVMTSFLSDQKGTNTFGVFQFIKYITVQWTDWSKPTLSPSCSLSYLELNPGVASLPALSSPKVLQAHHRNSLCIPEHMNTDTM